MKRTVSEKRKRRHMRIRKKCLGSPEKPRAAVFRSNEHIYVSLVVDGAGPSRVLTTVSSRCEEFSRKKEKGVSGGNVKGADIVGGMLAGKARDMGISKIVFDRGGYRYHGRVKALAEAARKGGLEF